MVDVVTLDLDGDGKHDVAKFRRTRPVWLGRNDGVELTPLLDDVIYVLMARKHRAARHIRDPHVRKLDLGAVVVDLLARMLQRLDAARGRDGNVFSRFPRRAVNVFVFFVDASAKSFEHGRDLVRSACRAVAQAELKAEPFLADMP